MTITKINLQECKAGEKFVGVFVGWYTEKVTKVEKDGWVYLFSVENAVFEHESEGKFALSCAMIQSFDFSRGSPYILKYNGLVQAMGRCGEIVREIPGAVQHEFEIQNAGGFKIPWRWRDPTPLKKSKTPLHPDDERVGVRSWSSP